jgi:hypothetical protein
MACVRSSCEMVASASEDLTVARSVTLVSQAASRRTGLITTGAIVAGATSVDAFAILFTSFAIMDPGLLAAPFAKPFIFVILLVYLLMALGGGVVGGTRGSLIGTWRAPVAPRRVTAS